MVNSGWNCSSTAPVYLHGIDRYKVTLGKLDSIIIYIYIYNITYTYNIIYIIIIISNILNSELSC